MFPQQAAAGEHAVAESRHRLRDDSPLYAAATGKGAAFYGAQTLGQHGALEADAAVKGVHAYLPEPRGKIHAPEILAAGERTLTHGGDRTGKAHTLDVVAAEKRPAGELLQARWKVYITYRAAAGEDAVFDFLDALVKAHLGEPSTAFEAVPAEPPDP